MNVWDTASAGDGAGCVTGAAGASLRFEGTNKVEPADDRLKVLLNDVANGNPGPPADIGPTDFAIEFGSEWRRVRLSRANPQ